MLNKFNWVMLKKIFKFLCKSRTDTDKVFVELV